jgi:hypothetical protein
MAERKAPVAGRKDEMPSLQTQADSGNELPQPPPLQAGLQAHIGRQLRAVYDAVANEPVPDRFLKLLEELERKPAEDK